jgi:hypothetical protein
LAGATAREADAPHLPSRKKEDVMKKAVMCIVETSNQAETLVSKLQQNGFATSDISVLFPDTRGTKDFAIEHHTKAPEGAVAGAAAGGLLGGTLGVLVGIGALAIPGLGPIIAAGPIVAALSGIGAGATVGGLGGALVGMGIPEVEAKRYEGHLRAGRILIAVHTDDRDQQQLAEGIFKVAKVHDVFTASEPSSTREPSSARQPSSVRDSSRRV